MKFLLFTSFFLLTGCDCTKEGDCDHHIKEATYYKSLYLQAESDRVEFAKWSVALDDLYEEPTIENYELVVNSKYSSYLEDDYYKVNKIGFKLGSPLAYKIIITAYLTHSIDKCNVSILKKVDFDTYTFDPKSMITFSAKNGNKQMQDLIVHLYKKNEVFERSEIEKIYREITQNDKNYKTEIDPCVSYKIQNH